MQTILSEYDEFMNGFLIQLIAAFFSGAFKLGARLVGMGLFMGFYFSKYFPTDDLLLFSSFFLSSFGLWKIFDYLDSKTDSLVKRLGEKR